MIKVLRKLDSLESVTFRLHLAYSIIEGIILGILALNEFVLIKSLKGTDFQIGILFQFTSALLLFSVLFNEWIKRSTNKGKMVRIIAWITRAPMLLLLFFPTSVDAISGNSVYASLFLLLFLLFYLANPIIYPIINLYLKNNFRHEHFGLLYSYSNMANKLVMLLATFLFGLWLDINPFAFTMVYPVMGLLGIISIYILAKIPYDGTNEQTYVQQNLWKSVRDSLANMMKIFRVNKPYRDFETGFALYGFAWMTTVAVITIFFEKELHLSYSSVAFYKNAYNLLSILLFPFFGKLIGNIDPRKFGVFTFLSLFFHFLFLVLTKVFPASTEIMGIRLYYMLIPAYLANAVFAATMGLLWYIGSAYFSKNQEAAEYQSIHLTMTGVRALYGPVLGVLFYRWFGTTLTFVFAMLALLAAMIVMSRSMRKYPV